MYTETSLLELLKKEDQYVKRLQIWEKSVKENTKHLDQLLAFHDYMTKTNPNSYEREVKEYQTRLKNATASRDKYANKLQTVRDQIKTYLKEVIQV